MLVVPVINKDKQLCRSHAFIAESMEWGVLHVNLGIRNFSLVLLRDLFASKIKNIDTCCHRPITIWPIVKPWTHLISPNLVSV